MFRSTAGLRQFMIDLLNDEEIIALCADYFPKVYNNFSTGMSKGQKIQLLIDHCSRYEVLPDLLSILQEQRPQQFVRRLGTLSSEQLSIGSECDANNSNCSTGEQANIAPSVLTSPPGGVAAAAEKVDIGNDVTGRDKIVSAGGHIINAESGAIVIINIPELPVSRDQSIDNALNSTGVTK